MVTTSRSALVNALSAKRSYNKGPLRFNNRCKTASSRRLPFVKWTPRNGVDFWSVPKTGGYAGGCQTGGELALIYLRHLKEHSALSGASVPLRLLVLDMFDWKEGGPEQDALRGQVIGFFGELERWLLVAAKKYGSEFNEKSDKASLKAANEGLRFTDETSNARLSTLLEAMDELDEMDRKTR